MKTATQIARAMALPAFAHDAIAEYIAHHPQTRTEAFHKFYGAPIHKGPVTPQFEYMDDQRVAFRMAFILSEAIEIMEKGLGLRAALVVSAHPGATQEYKSEFTAIGSANGGLTTAILAAMKEAGPQARNVVEVVDGLGDLNVVVNGFALELGANMVRVDEEICASNFTKAGPDGKPIVSDGTDGHPKGKVLKGPNFVEPNIAAVLRLENGK